MQTKVSHIIKELNTFIINFNADRHLATPLCHRAIVRRHGKGKKGYYKTHWDRLKDGIHGTKQTRQEWGNSLTAAIRNNRGLRTPAKRDLVPSDDEMRSPKRSWKRERKH